MKKESVALIVLVVIVGAGVYLYAGNTKTQTPPPVVTATASPKNSTYIIDGKAVTLINGAAETEAAPGSASKITTKYFGNEVRGDLTGDGKEDTVFLVTQNTGGSGTFYYVVVAVNTGGAFLGTNAVFLGDRIAPQTTEIKNGQLVVNYAERKSGEPMTAQPSVGMSKYLKVEGMSLTVVQ